MCQMLNIWHIYHTKYKNDALWDVPNFKNYTTWLQYRCKFATVRTNVVKIYYFIFSFLSPLSSFFLFSSLSLSGSLSLLPVSVPSLFGGEASETDMCQEQNSGADSDYRRAYPLWSTGTTRGWDSASEVEDHWRDWTLRVPTTLDQPCSISPTLQPCSISPISPQGRHRSSSLSSLSTFHSTSLWLWVFFLLQFGLIWWWWWTVGYGRWQWQWWWTVGVMAVGVFFFFFCCNLGWFDGGGGLWAMGDDNGSGGGLWGWWPVVAVDVVDDKGMG